MISIVASLYSFTERSTIFSLLILLSTCSPNEPQIRSSKHNNLNSIEKTNSYLDTPLCYNLSETTTDNKVYYFDTVTAKTSEELLKQIKSNRLINLIDKDYILRSSSSGEKNEGLLIDSIKNLKIVGTASSKLLAYEQNASVLKISNAYNIHLENLIIGHTENPEYNSEHGVLEINHSYNLNISNCKLLGSGTFGLVTYDVYNLKFSNSEITECTALIFDLEKSRKLEFKNTKFHNNNLSVSVLGGFTNLTKEVRFLNCAFLDNKPRMPGNPAFNFYENSEDLKNPIVFTNCRFKNNKGFKWYGEKIELNNCKVDSTGFIGF